MDGDPHFVVDFPLSKLTVCFNIDGEPGDILRLVSDHLDSGKYYLPLWYLGKVWGWGISFSVLKVNGQL